MKNKKIISIILSIVGVLILLGGYFCITKSKNTEVKETPENYQPMVLPVKSSESIDVTLKVLDKVYVGKVKEGSSVYEAMETFKNNSSEDNPFSFVSKEYKGLGFFIEEINGVKGVSGKYWIFYVNGEKASVGVSDYKLKEGDVISWKQEKNF